MASSQGRRRHSEPRNTDGVENLEKPTMQILLLLPEQPAALLTSRLELILDAGLSKCECTNSITSSPKSSL